MLDIGTHDVKRVVHHLIISTRSCSVTRAAFVSTVCGPNPTDTASTSSVDDLRASAVPGYSSCHYQTKTCASIISVWIPLYPLSPTKVSLAGSATTTICSVCDPAVIIRACGTFKMDCDDVPSV